MFYLYLSYNLTVSLFCMKSFNLNGEICLYKLFVFNLNITYLVINIEESYLESGNFNFYVLLNFFIKILWLIFYCSVSII